MQVRSLHIYPVKSTAALSLDEVAVEPWGLAGDRRWSVIDEAGQRLVGWDVPLLLRVLAIPIEGGSGSPRPAGRTSWCATRIRRRGSRRHTAGWPRRCRPAGKLPAGCPSCSGNG